MPDKVDKSKFKLIYENNPELEPVAKTPTKKNPDVIVEVGRNPEGKAGVRTIEYPADKYSLRQATQKVQKFKTETEADCPICKSFDTVQSGNAPPQPPAETEQPRGLLSERLGVGDKIGSFRDRIGGFDGGSLSDESTGGRDRFPMFNRPAPLLDRVKERSSAINLGKD